MANVIRFACKLCGQEINIPAPQQAGMYAITCPHCHRQMKIKYSAKPITMASSPQPISSHSSSNTEKLRHASTRRFNSSEELLKGTSPKVSQVSTGIARLSLVRIGCEKEYFPLHKGDNIVGRRDSTQPSDIEIYGDPTISRRSIKLTVSEEDGGFTYSLTVLKTLNPVLVNGSTIAVGQTVHLVVGASIYIGQTMLRMEK